MLGERLGARSEEEWNESRTVLDTADGRLRRAALVLEVVDAPDRPRVLLSRGWGRAPEELPVPIRDLPLDASGLPARIRRKVGEALDGRRLEEVGAIQVTVHSLAVRDDEQKTMLRVTVETSGDSAWVRLLPVKGYRSAAVRALRRIGALGLLPDAEPLETLDAARIPPRGGERPPTSQAARAPHRAPSGASAAELWLRVLSGQLELISRHLPAAIEGADAEALHDLRVAVRRSRSALRHARRVLPAELIGCFRPVLSELQRATAPVRDLDVLVESLARESDPELAALTSLARHRRSRARRDLEAVLGSESTSALLEDWGATLAALAAALGAEEADEWGPWPARAPQPAGEVVAHRIERQRRRLLSLGSALDEFSPAEDFHELRKQAKELRYLIELFGEHMPELAGPGAVKALKRLQDLLGDHQDCTVQLQTLPGLRDALQPSARHAVDRLLVRLEQRRADQRRAILERFAKLAGQVAAA